MSASVASPLPSASVMSESRSRSGSAMHASFRPSSSLEGVKTEVVMDVVGDFGRESISSASGRERGYGGDEDRKGMVVQDVGPWSEVTSVSAGSVPINGEVRVKVEQSGVDDQGVSREGSEVKNVDSGVKKEGEGQLEETKEKKEVEVTIVPEAYAEAARLRGRAKGRSEDEAEAMGRVAFR